MLKVYSSMIGVLEMLRGVSTGQASLAWSRGDPSCEA